MGDICGTSLLICSVLLIIATHEINAQCKFPTHKAENQAIEAHIKPLLGKRYRAVDKAMAFTYDIGICTDAVVMAEISGAHEVGVYQLELKDGKLSNNPGKVIGKYDNTTMTKGTGWILLEYNNGDKYNNHCGMEHRRARIMIMCDDRVAIGNEVVNVFEEENNKTRDCYYLFEMATSAVCTPTPTVTFGLSIGSVVVIIFVCVVFLYLILGIVYNRFMLGAKGMEQIPNYSFWQDFGNLEADGCNLVCRARGSAAKHSFRGLGDDQLQDEEERDDHLLPM